MKLGDLAMLSPYGIGAAAAVAAAHATATPLVDTLLTSMLVFVTTTAVAAQAATKLALHLDNRGDAA